jgi:hypothetical protein
MENQIRRVNQEFYKAFAGFDLHTKTQRLNQGFILKEAQDGLRLVESLHGYQSFLQKARERKAKLKGSSVAFEREVIAQARQALEDTRSLMSKTLRIAKHFKNTGLVDEMLSDWTAAVKASGKVRLQDVWLDALDSEEVRQVFHNADISQSSIAALTAHVSQFEQVLQVKENNLTVKTSQNDLEMIITRRSPSAHPKDVDDLLFGNLFDAAAEVFHIPGSMLVDAVPHQKVKTSGHNVTDPMDSILIGASQSVQELARHLRKLEHTGLAIHQGNDPISILIVGLFIAAGAALAVGATILILCAAEVFTGTVCTVGWILLGLSALLFISAGVAYAGGLTIIIGIGAP